ncbi:MAG: hypothetical protein HeimC2_00790 [Candidatus Heimdallarchaeota archaeon LC_2]|nr:MAG: hypothetical protein HeimC2_00790 [Candidatus Heimdallarchaeota archaeon LC_2]
MNDKPNLENFSWVEKNIIAGSSIPRSKEEFDFLINEGIRVIINLTEFPVFPKDKFTMDKFIFHQISIPDFTAPTIEQINEFKNLVEKYKEWNFPILVHCYAGCGRTGTFLASYLMFSKQFKTYDEALIGLRKLRPCSVETESQIIVLKQYELQILK